MKFKLAPYDDDSFSSSKVMLLIDGVVIQNTVENIHSHGGISHFIKHGLEFEETAESWHRAASFCRETLASDDRVGVVNNAGEPLSPKRILKMGKEATGSLLDLMNDRYYARQETSDCEKKILLFLQEQTLVYHHFIQQQIELIEKRLNNTEFFSFTYTFEGTAHQAWYQKSKTALFIVGRDEIVTGFRINKNRGHDKRALEYFESRGFNPVVDKKSGQTMQVSELLGS